MSPRKAKVQYGFESSALLAVRLACVAAVLFTWLYPAPLQGVIDRSWAYLKENSIYRSIAFETLYTLGLGTFFSIFYYRLEHTPFIFNAYVHREKPVEMPPTGLFYLGKHALLFGIMDMITPKHYGNVDPKLYEEKKGFFNFTRIFPEEAPTVWELFGGAVAALLIYDVLFFTLHITLHKVPFLWKTIHREHHDQTEMNTYETVHIHPLEYMMLVLLGNESLRLLAAHPMCHTLFNTWIVYFLFSNHSAVDLPLSIDKIVPLGLVHGPLKHEHHHIGNPYKTFAPIFSHLDWLLEFYTHHSSPKQKAL